MVFDFLSGLSCVLQDETADYLDMIKIWRSKECHTAFMPAIWWNSGIFNLFDQRAHNAGSNMIWLIPAMQAGYSVWLSDLREKIERFYSNDVINKPNSPFPNMNTEEIEECILLHSNDLQNDSERTILGANVVLVRFSLSNGSETLAFILLDHQDLCWHHVIENHRVALTWFVDSGRGIGDYYVQTNLFQLMQRTAFPELLPIYYFKGLYNKGEIPNGFQYLYSMISQKDIDGYDKWEHFSAVYSTGWRQNQ